MEEMFRYTKAVNQRQKNNTKGQTMIYKNITQKTKDQATCVQL